MMQQLKNLFVILVFGFIILFFVPFPNEYIALKTIIAIMVISYGITLGAFRNKKLKEKNNEDVEKYIHVIEDKLTQLESQEEK